MCHSPFGVNESSECEQSVLKMRENRLNESQKMPQVSQKDEKSFVQSESVTVNEFFSVSFADAVVRLPLLLFRLHI